MSKTNMVGAGAALFAVLVQPTNSFAQTRADEDVALVVKSDWGGLRAPRQGDNDPGVIGLTSWMAQFPKEGETGFRAIQAENRSACSRTGSWIKQSIVFMGRADKLTHRNAVINTRLVALGDDLNNAARARTGGNIISTVLLCLLSWGKYCGAAVAQGMGNQAQGMAHTKQSKLNRDQSILNSDQSQLQLDISVMNLDMSIGWAEMITGYCLKYHVDATIGYSVDPSVAATASAIGAPAPAARDNDAALASAPAPAPVDYDRYRKRW